MISNYELFQEDFGSLAVISTTVGAGLWTYAKLVSSKNTQQLEDAFLTSYEDNLFSMTLEVNEESRSKLMEFITNVNVSRRMKSKVLDDKELVLINNRHAYTFIMMKLSKYPIFRILKSKNTIEFKPEEFSREHKKLIKDLDKVISGFTKVRIDQNSKKIYYNLIWLGFVLEKLVKDDNSELINKITFHSYPPTVSYSQQV